MANNTSLALSSLARKGNLLIAFVLVLMPFHAFLTTWLGSLIGHSDLLLAWKEILLLVGGLLALVIFVKDKSCRWRPLSKLLLTRLIIGYALFVVLAAGLTWLFNRASVEAILFGLIIQLRIFAVLLLAGFFAVYDELLVRNWLKLILIPAAIVVVFGLLQVAILPNDFLSRFGYGPDTIPAVQTVDNKQEYQRIQSTVRGANPLGAYLVLVICACAVGLIKRPRSKRILALGFLSSLALYFTYSRSAWIALAVAVPIFVLIRGPHLINKKSVTAVLASLVLLFGGVWLNRDNDYIQNTIFHVDENSRSEQSSNAQRGSALLKSSEQVIEQPLGRGLGTAGPASYRNELAKPRIAENYFVQTGQELGVIGLGLFGSIMILLGTSLWRLRQNSMALMLLISLAGVTLINLVSHAWADDTLAFVWGALAGSFTAYAILNKVQTSHNEKAKSSRV